MESEAHLADLARRHGLELVLLFGSAARGRLQARSDVDLAVLLAGRRDLPWDERGELVHGLSSLYPGREVDLALINSADPLFLKQIAEGAQLLHGSPRRLAELRMTAFRRYQDHRRFLDLERSYLRRFLGVA